MINTNSAIARILLNYLFLNTAEELYTNQIVSKFGLDKRNLVKKIKELEKEGIIKSREMGNIRLFSINKDYPLYKEYKTIILKSSGIETELKELLKKQKKVSEAYIFGSYATDKMGEHSDIDVLVVGGHSIYNLQKEVDKLQKLYGREINIVNMDEKDYNNKKKKNDPFVNKILKGKHIKII